MPNNEKSLHQDLEERIRDRGVRVDPRLTLLRLLEQPEGADMLKEQIEALKKRIEDAAARVRRALR